MVAVLLGLVGSLAPTPTAAPVGAAAVPGTERALRTVLFDLVNLADPPASTLTSETATLRRVGRHAWLNGLQWSTRGRDAVVDDLFDTILRRPVDAGARATFRSRLVARGRMVVSVDLYASAEYRTTRGGGSDGGWIDAVYLDALGRPADSGGRTYFLDRLAAGTTTRSAVADQLVRGAEGRRVLAKRLIVELLRRPADEGLVVQYLPRLDRGESVESVITAMLLTSTYQTLAAYPLGSNQEVWLLRTGNRLRRATTGAIDVSRQDLAITGLAAGEEVLAIEERPRDRVLYGVTSRGRLVTIDTAGEALALGQPLASFPATTAVDLDIDPYVDQVQVVAGARRWSVDPDTGPVGKAPTDPVTFAAGDRFGGRSGAVTGLFAGHTGTGVPRTPGEWFGVDASRDRLVRQRADGTLATVGPLHLDATAVNGFDGYWAGPDVGFALLRTANAGVGLWRIDVTTGWPRLVSSGAPADVRGFAITFDFGVSPDRLLFAVQGPSVAAPELVVSAPGGAGPSESFPLLGLPTGETVVGLDVRPSTGVLYALTGDGQLWTVLVTTEPNVATLVAVGDGLPDFDQERFVGFEVDPVADEAIVVHDGPRSRLRLSDGAVVGGPDLLRYAAGQVGAGQTPEIAGLAHTRSAQGDAPTESVEYGITQGVPSPMTGAQLVRVERAPSTDVRRVATLSQRSVLRVSDVIGFDISGSPGRTAWVLLEDPDGVQQLYDLDLATGVLVPRVLIAPDDVTAFAVL